MSREWSGVPTWREQGVECVTGTWRGVAGTAGLTVDQIACWDAAFSEVAQSDEWNAALEHNGWTNTYMDSAATRAFLATEREGMGRALTELGLIAAR
jgi:putative tricarboxylic transport membrane protein